LKLRALLLAALLLAGCARKNLTTPQLYKRHCARCHGGRGEGNPRGLRRYPHLDLLSSPMVRRGDRAAVRQRILEGDGPMPGYARRLAPEEIEKLVDFTFQLSRKEKP
jgi:mono/diheme cytochrome c family protein